MNPKISDTGKYTRFIGLSVVAHVSDRDGSRWKDLYEYMCSLKNFCNYYTPLPHLSYHMTVRPVCDSFRSESEFIDSAMLKFSILVKIRELCYMSSVSPKVRITNAYFGSTFGLTVRFDDEKDHRKVTTLRSSIAKLLSAPDTKGDYHITLGYMYREGIEKCEDARKEQRRLFDKLSSCFTNDNLVQCELSTLVYFTNMTNFTTV